MDFQVLYTEPALEDLQALVAWSWQRHTGITEQFAEELLDRVDRPARFPFMGAPVIGFPNIRRILHAPFHIYYRVDASRGRIEILHFWHAARKPPEL